MMIGYAKSSGWNLVHQRPIFRLDVGAVFGIDKVIIMNKILYNNCKSMSDDTIEAIAKHIASKTDFGMVESISENGQRLADALEKYTWWKAPFQILLIDDVLITSEAMEAAKAAQPVQVHPDDVVGYVIFATPELPTWCNAVFMLDD